MSIPIEKIGPVLRIDIYNLERAGIGTQVPMLVRWKLCILAPS